MPTYIPFAHVACAQIRVRSPGFPHGEIQQKAFVEKMIDLPRNDPAQWHNVACGAYEHRLVGRHMDPKKRTFEVVSLSRVLGPAMLVRDPAGVQDQDDSLVHRYYVSAHHTDSVVPPPWYHTTSHQP